MIILKIYVYELVILHESVDENFKQNDFHLITVRKYHILIILL